MTLCWSRMTWLHFFYDMERPSFLRGHIDGFAFFFGVPRQLVYDNLKSACIERVGNAARFNESLLEMASHYGFEPILAAPRRGNEKSNAPSAMSERASSRLANFVTSVISTSRPASGA